MQPLAYEWIIERRLNSLEVESRVNEDFIVKVGKI